MPSKKKIIRSIKEWFMEKGFVDSICDSYFYRLDYGCAEYGKDKDPVVAKKMSYDLFDWLEEKLGIGNVFNDETLIKIQHIDKIDNRIP